MKFQKMAIIYVNFYYLWKHWKRIYRLFPKRIIEGGFNMRYEEIKKNFIKQIMETLDAFAKTEENKGYN